MKQDGTGNCQDCSGKFSYYLVHNGFNDSAYAYCSACGRTAILSAYTVPRGAPFEAFGKIGSGTEPFLKRCTCGGRFTTDATPRCPACRRSLSPIDARSWIEANAPGRRRGWRWQLSWDGPYCIVIDWQIEDDPWIVGALSTK